MKTCTGCIALCKPTSSGGYCSAGYQTKSTKDGAYRVRIPMEDCPRPRTQADLDTIIADRIRAASVDVSPFDHWS